MWKKPLLPQNDSNKQERKDEIKEEQEKYRYKYTYPALDGVAMADGVPFSEFPKLPWTIKLVEIGLKLAENVAENKVDDEKNL